NLLEFVASVRDFVVGPKQPAGNDSAFVDALARSVAAMADSQFTQHPTDHAIEISIACQMRKELGVLLFHGRPIGAVHVGIIKEVAVDAPGVVKHLFPLGRRVDANLDRLEIQRLRSRVVAAGLGRRAAAWRGAAAPTTPTARYGSCQTGQCGKWACRR